MSAPIVARVPGNQARTGEPRRGAASSFRAPVVRMTAVERDHEWETLVSRWVYVPDVATRVGLADKQIRALIRDRKLLAFRVGPNGAMAVPEDFLVPEGDGEEILTSLRGTLTMLNDAGYDELESLRWLYTPNDQLDATPIQALRAGRVTTVRRAAQAIDY